MGKLRDRLISALIRAPVKAEAQGVQIEGDAWARGEDTRIEISRQAALNSATYYACMRIRCDALAKLPIKIMQETDDAGSVKRRDHPLWELLALRPNPHMSAYDLLWMTEYQRLDMGNAYWAVDIRQGKVCGIYPLDAARVSVYRYEGISDRREDVYYTYDDPRKGQLVFFSDEIVHFKNYSLDGIYGTPMRQYLAAQIYNENQATTVLKNRYDSGLQDPLTVEYAGDISEANEEKIRKKFEKLGGPKQAGRVIPIPTSFRLNQLETKLVNSQFFELQGLGTKRIANAFGVKNFQLNDLSSGTFQNIEQQNKAFYSETLAGAVTEYEMEMDYVLFSSAERKKGFYTHFNVDAMLRSDLTARYSAYNSAIAAGWMSREEAREKEGLSFIPGTERLSVNNGAAIWLDDLGKQYDKAQTGGEPDETEKNDDQGGAERPLD